MSTPGFTAGSAVYRGSRTYSHRAPAPSTRSGLVPALPCGFYCNCDPGQCCEVTLGGANCACKTCSTHLEETQPQFVYR